MGSGSSRMGRGRTRTSPQNSMQSSKVNNNPNRPQNSIQSSKVNNNPNRPRLGLRLASFICGAGASDPSSSSTSQWEDCVDESWMIPSPSPCTKVSTPTSSNPDSTSPSTSTSRPSDVDNVVPQTKQLHNHMPHPISPTPTPTVFQTHPPQLPVGDEPIPEVLPAPLVPDTPSQPTLLHVDVLTIPSNALPDSSTETTTREARRNSRRMFWDAFSSRNTRSHADFSPLLFTNEDASLVGSRRRWLLDIGDDLFDDGIGVESWHFGRTGRATNEPPANSRTEFWDRLRGAANESGRRTTCPFDLHPDGLCSCEVDEEDNALTSISRIVLLAEALFEVLDEIHRQPESFSLSMVSFPAPESVVDSLPIRTYENPSTANSGDDLDQCYICLVEYEEGDKIRVLPCHHEYHMSCVDRWLKEVHGVCPLCRGDVRGEVIREGVASSSDANVT